MTFHPENPSPCLLKGQGGEQDHAAAWGHGFGSTYLSKRCCPGGAGSPVDASAGLLKPWGERFLRSLCIWSLTQLPDVLLGCAHDYPVYTLQLSIPASVSKI